MATWITLGTHLGWTQTSVATTRKDPVTELEYQDYQKRFLPGVDFLAAGVLTSAVVYGLSRLARQPAART